MQSLIRLTCVDKYNYYTKDFDNNISIQPLSTNLKRKILHKIDIFFS